MIKIAVVLTAYFLVYLISNESVDRYYYYCSAAYSMVAMLSFVAYLKTDSKMLFFYMAVNYLYSIMHLLVNYGNFYELMRGIIWHDTINFSLILTVSEAVLLLSGGGSVFVFIINMLLTDNAKHESRTNGMVRTK